MKARVTYEESITYTQFVDIDDQDYFAHFGSMVITPDRVKEFLMTGESWEHSLADSRNHRNVDVDHAETYIEEVEVIIL